MLKGNAVEVEALGKRFRIGPSSPRANTIRDAMASFAQSLVHRGGRSGTPAADTADGPDQFWALRDVDFSVRVGEAVGIIGPNGAGKSTLLKILSRITEPTEGQVRIRGRVGSLLEVGTGFHSELTGRENTYLSGAILGMSRAEIDRKFDEIVAFAEIDRFIDTPTKHYSSGMFLRLAFAVAAHLEPDILIVDEVLAVGDASFQRKCLGKMQSVAEQGRTVLFVSHDVSAVSRLCTRGLVLDRGRIVFAGSPDACVETYSAFQPSANHRWERSEAGGEGPEGALVIDALGATLTGEQPRHELVLSLEVHSSAPHKPAFFAVDIHDSLMQPIMQAIPGSPGFLPSRTTRSTLGIRIELPPLVPGRYLVSVWAGSHNTATLDEVRHALSFEVLHSPVPGRTFPHTRDHGFLVPTSEIWIEGG
jgi:lipopolysaccharide transport system ATP-binding protein